MLHCVVLAHRSVVTSRNIMHHMPSKRCVMFLQLGHWVLFDNVNFCSPSVRFAARHALAAPQPSHSKIYRISLMSIQVLDRLNALFEPGGELVISERGLDSSGPFHLSSPP